MKGETALFDGNARIGLRKGAEKGEPSTVRELLIEMDRLGIGKSLVWHYSARDTGYDTGNRRLLAEIGGHSRLVPCCALVSFTGGESCSAPEYLDGVIRQGARAGIVFPTGMNWSLDEWCAGSLLDACEKRRLPLLVPYEETPLGALNAVCENHPRLPVILIQANYQFTRMIFPLLKAHRNLHCDISAPFSIEGGLERLVHEIGPGKIIFGSRYPESEAGAAVTYLRYARIPVKARALIASGNLERLIAGEKA